MFGIEIALFITSAWFLFGSATKQTPRSNGVKETMDRKPTLRPQNSASQPRPEIIVVSKDSGFASGTLEYALGVAERLSADILALSVNTLPDMDDEQEPQRALRFASDSAASADGQRRRARKRGVAFRHLCRNGKVRRVLSDILHEHRHVSFVLVEPSIPLAEVAQRLPVPVFSVTGAGAAHSAVGKGRTASHARTFGTISREIEKQGAHAMAETSKKQARSKALLFGVLSAAIYGAVFGNSELVMEYFTKGGFYNILPVVTVITVSYVHGSFASNVWTALGVNASRKSVSSKKEAPARQTPRPRATMQA